MAPDKALILVFGRRLEEVDDLDEALTTAYYMNESDEGWFDKIEIIAPDGTSTVMDDTHPTVRDFFDAETRKVMERYDRSRAERPFIGNVTIDGETLRSFYGEQTTDDMWEFARQLQARLDPARVEVQTATVRR